METGKSILVVNYDDAAGEVRTELLQRAGFAISVAFNLYEALRSLNYRSFHLVLVAPVVLRADVREILASIREKRYEGELLSVALMYAGSAPSEFNADAYINAHDGERALLTTVSLLIYKEVRLPEKRGIPKPPRLTMPKPPRPIVVPKPGKLSRPKPPRPQEQPRLPKLNIPKPPKRT